MRKRETVLIVCVLVALCLTGLIVYFYFKYKEEEEKNAKLQEDNLRLVLDSIRKSQTLSDEIKKQLISLVSQHEYIDGKVASELKHALFLLEAGENESAIQNLVKIIEHLLNVHYLNHIGFKAWLKMEKKKLDLFGMLTYCKTEKKIDEIEYQFFLAIKKIRDKEVHTLDLKVDDYLKASGLITAVGGVMKLSAVVYPIKRLN